MARVQTNTNQQRVHVEKKQRGEGRGGVGAGHGGVGGGGARSRDDSSSRVGHSVQVCWRHEQIPHNNPWSRKGAPTLRSHAHSQIACTQLAQNLAMIRKSPRKVHASNLFMCTVAVWATIADALLCKARHDKTAACWLQACQALPNQTWECPPPPVAQKNIGEL